MIANVQGGYIVYRKFVVLLGIIIILFVVISGQILSYIIKTKLLQLLSIEIILAPAILVKWLLDYYSRKASFIFSNGCIEVTLNKDNTVESSHIYSLKEIKDYQIQFPNWRYADIKLRLKSGKKVSFSFYRKKNEAEKIDTDSVINSFHDFIKSYNQSADDKIRLLPSFYASIGGMVSIILLVLLFIAVIIVHILVGKMGILPITLLLVLGLIIQVILRRRNDLKYFNKMK